MQIMSTKIVKKTNYENKKDIFGKNKQKLIVACKPRKIIKPIIRQNFYWLETIKIMHSKMMTNTAFIINDSKCPECSKKYQKHDVLCSLEDPVINNEELHKWNCKIRYELKKQWGQWPQVYQNMPKIRSHVKTITKSATKNDETSSEDSTNNVDPKKNYNK